MALSKEKLWKAMQTPLEKTCDNCIHLEDHSQLRVDKCTACNEGGKMGLEHHEGRFPNNDWEWNGVK